MKLPSIAWPADPNPPPALDHDEKWSWASRQFSVVESAADGMIPGPMNAVHSTMTEVMQRAGGEVHSDHERLEARSIALHSAALRKIARNPELLRIPKRNIERWRAARSAGPAPACLDEWSRILRRPWPEIAAFIMSPSEDAIRLRQSSPFAGVLSASERKRIYDEFRP